jgi:hypothetical protein
MLCLNFIFIFIFCVEAFPDLARKPERRELTSLISMILVGCILPIGLTVLGAFPGLPAACPILAAGLAYRRQLVLYPHTFG